MATVAGVRGIGTVVNVATILVGTTTGVVLGARLPERLRTSVLQAVGLVPLVALILGAAIGEALRIEDRLAATGDAVRARFAPQEDRFVEGFVAASLLFCVGPLTILGSIRDGLGGPDHAQLLLVKAALDGVVAIAFASTLGWGVGFSIVTIVVVQGTLTLAAGGADRLLTDR